MYVEKGEKYLPEISLTELKELYNKELSDKAKARLRYAYLRKMGESIPAIAKATGKRESTVSDILRRFNERGLKASHAIKQKGQPNKLSPRELKKLHTAIINPPMNLGLPFTCWTTSLVEYFIMAEFGKFIVRRHLQRILNSLGLSLTRMKKEQLEVNKNLQEKYGRQADWKLKQLFQTDRRSKCWLK